MCHARLHAAEDKAAEAGKRQIEAADYVPACVESCPTGAIRFGDLNDGASEVAKASRTPEAFRLLARLGTEPKIYYTSKRAWVRALAERHPAGEPSQPAAPVAAGGGEVKHG
jgi:molybdopterin-containing oxidoreductase family iron-sulfur binding subunit